MTARMDKPLNIGDGKASSTSGEPRSLLNGQSTSPRIQLAVVGAHLSGLPLNYQLTDAGATFRCTTDTAPSYRLFNLPSASQIKKPGLKRIISPDEVGSAIEVEIWDISSKGLGEVLISVPPPLAIGSVEISDGTWIKGFVCEPWGLSGAIDITSFGGWRAYLSSLHTVDDPTSDITLVSKPLFKAILIANRGEIAVRIIKTLKKLGIKSIAVYSREDSKSQHVKDADSSFLLPGDTISATYLASDAIIQIAKESGAEAIIPGYGFLSESAAFAEACETSGLIWIGPTPKQMKSLGLKHLARELARNTGNPLLPGTGLLTNIETAITEADAIGYPIIIKSSAGGGGIGLQQCDDVETLRETFESIRHLGQSFFKNDSIFLEKYVKNARHVEVQIIGNGKGLVKHAGERDCSLQRRKQKVIEEGPAVFIPENVRQKMRIAAINLASRVKYRGVGTVEFIYNLKDQSFYFLEVNTRLQVEHPVTEEITGLDLVEAMVRIAANDSDYLFSDSNMGYPVNKVSIEARIYGESPLQGFRPSPGQLQHVSFPENIRVDTWISPGSILSSSYDPLLAKFIVTGLDRAEAVHRLSGALDATQLSGIETNIDYLKQIVKSSEFQNGTYTTTFLDEFRFRLPVFEILEPGSSTTVQDFPGRQGLWHVGVPPSGPMDDYAFRIANRILNNEVGAAGLEFTHSGPKLSFHHDAYIAIVGGPATLKINGIEAPLHSPNCVKSGQTLELGTLKAGCRAYMAIKGGINVPQVFGSRSTFSLGKLGGHNGRALRIGDMMPFYESAAEPTLAKDISLSSIMPAYTNSWAVKVMPGPHAYPDFFSQASFTELFTQPWKVHYNSNRVGVRLTGPKPKWARSNGGAAGLHPSNIHDSPYSIGSISFTGDEAVILTCDGPSLGGFVVFATVVSAEMWKLGQMRPGDEILLDPVTAAEAVLLSEILCKSIKTGVSPDKVQLAGEIEDPILGDVGTPEMKIICRQAGDKAMLLEFGEEDFDIRTSFVINRIIEAHIKQPITGVVEATPGARSLHISYNPATSQENMIAILRDSVSGFSSDIFSKNIPSRIFDLPLAFEDSSSLAAVERYAQTIRSEAPWLPSNVDFLRRINGLPSKNDVNDILLSATYLVVGLGDVFFGSPCAIPLDPRHRLFGMKYNPSRSFTLEGTVGVGGQYLCIYGMDSPGGYQLVGRTLPIWNVWAKKVNRWLFNVFDRIRFYSVSEEVLETAREAGTAEELITVEDGAFNLQEYESWLEKNRDDIEEVAEQRWKTLNESDAVSEALEPPPPPPIAISKENNSAGTSNGTVLRAGVAGKCWKSAVSIGDTVGEGQILFWIEAMKMEIKILAPFPAICKDILVNPGDILSADSPLAVLAPISVNGTTNEGT